MGTKVYNRSLGVRDLLVERGGRVVVARVSFNVRPGEALLLTGPNGAGKTTLIRALAGLLPVADGHVQLSNCDAAESLGTYCHYVGHQNALKGSMTAVENLTFWARFIGGGDPGLVEGAVAAMGLDGLGDIAVRYLSAGQQRRAALARLLVARQPVWLLDEPTVSLDASNVARLEAICSEHLAKGGVVVAATHVPFRLRSATELRLAPLDLSAGDTVSETRQAGAGA